MANPQLEDGYIRIAREIQEKLCRFRVPGEAALVFNFIVLKTWGWSKKEDRISLSQFCLGTGMKKPNVVRAREKLVEMNMIHVIKKDNDECTIYRVNKDFDTWKQLSKKITLSKAITTVIETDNDRYQFGERALSKAIPTKETLTKETKQKKLLQKKECDLPGKEFPQEAKELSELLIQQILKNHPTNQISRPEKQIRVRHEWPRHFDLMIRRDNRGPPEIREMILWATEHEFWTGNILSAGKLREKWDTLTAQRKRDGNRKPRTANERARDNLSEIDRWAARQGVFHESHENPGSLNAIPGNDASDHGRALVSPRRFDPGAVGEWTQEILPDP